MPDPRERLDEGIRREQAGLLDGARLRYEEVAAAGVEEPAATAEALMRLANVHRAQCRWQEAIDAARRSAEIAEAAGLTDRQAEALNAEAGVYLSRGEFDDARVLLERMLEVSDDPRLQGIALQNLGAISAQTGDLDGADAFFDRSLDCFRRARYVRGEALALNNHGRAALDRGHGVAAIPSLRRALELAMLLEDAEVAALVSLNLAEAQAAGGDLERAEELAMTALGFYSTSENAWRRVECLRLLGDLHRRSGDDCTAVACWEQGLRLANEVGSPREAATLAERLATVALPPDPPCPAPPELPGE